MQHPPTLRRAIVLALSLLSGCAATGSAAPDTPAHTASAADPDFGAYLVGKVAAQEGDLRLAAQSFLHAAAADPDSEIVAQQAFLACLLAGRPETEALARDQYGNPLAQLYLGDLSARRGHWADALQRYAGLPRVGMTQVLQPLLTAWAQFGIGRADEALSTLRPYVDGERFRGVYALHAAMIADLAHRDPEAARLYHVAQTSFGDTNLELARLLASWQARQGNAADADRLLASLVQVSPDLAITLPALEKDAIHRQVRNATDGIAEAYLALAAALRVQDASDYAALLLHLALDLRPDLTGARLLQSEIDADAGHPDRALADLHAVTQDDPLIALVDLRRATLLDRLGRTDDALSVLAGLEKTEPTRPEPWTMQGSILRAQHRYADAVAAYDQAVARVPNPTRVNWPLFYERGIALDQAGRWPAAEADLRHALALSPDEPFVMNYLAYSWTEKGVHLTEARQMLERAVAAQPNDGAIIDSLGWLLLRQGKTAEAVKTLEHAVELQPEDPTLNGHLGDAYAAAGRTLEAGYQWHRALTLNPDPDEATRIEAKLRGIGVAPPDTGTAAAASDAKPTP